MPPPLKCSSAGSAPVRRFRKRPPSAAAASGRRPGGNNPPLERALRHHQAGRLAEAETLYRHILARAPDHGDALHFLGVLIQQTGPLEEALRLLERAVALQPTAPEAVTSLGNVLLALGRDDEAVAAYRRALAASNDPDALRDSERAWLAARDAAPADIDQLRALYAERIQALGGPP